MKELKIGKILVLKLDNDSLQKYCLKLEDFLKHDVYYDIDGLDLSSELNVLKEIFQKFYK